MPTVLWTIATLSGVLFLRNLFARYLMASSMLLTHSTKLGKVLYVLIFFPGVVIHELSHFFTASLLGVHTGTIEIFPMESQEGTRLGSINVGKTDFVRNAIVGSSPLIVGLLLMVAIARVMFPFALKDQSMDSIIHTIIAHWSWYTLLYLYLLYTISNTMALSKSDREGLFPTLVLLVGIGLIAALSPKTSAIIEAYSIAVISALTSLAASLTFVFTINLLCFLPVYFLVKVLERIRMKKIRLRTF